MLMVSGTSNTHPLLTIAIPTWERAQTLNKALSNLLPQVVEFKNEIQVVISDNASIDNTQQIVSVWISKFSEIDILYNRNSKNIDFFGNFAKCRELAFGEYIWLLSDDDFVFPNLIKNIIYTIKNNKDLAVIYLKNANDSSGFNQILLQKEEFIKTETNAISLISKCIFFNIKSNDKILIEQYRNNAFIGFIFLLNSFNHSNKVIIIRGKSLKVGQDKPKGYKYFDVFINHMQDVINYMEKIGISRLTILTYRNKYLLHFLLPIFLIYKAEQKLSFGTFTEEEIATTKEVNRLIKKNYRDLVKYWMIFYPLSMVPPLFLSSLLQFKRIIKKKIEYFYPYF